MNKSFKTNKLEMRLKKKNLVSGLPKPGSPKTVVDG